MHHTICISTVASYEAVTTLFCDKGVIFWAIQYRKNI